MPIRKVPRTGMRAHILEGCTGSPTIAVMELAQQASGDRRQGLLEALQILTCLPVPELERQLRLPSRWDGRA